MTKPYKLYKGEEIQENVYPDDLQKWLDEGWTLGDSPSYSGTPVPETPPLPHPQPNSQVSTEVNKMPVEEQTRDDEAMLNQRPIGNDVVVDDVEESDESDED